MIHPAIKRFGWTLLVLGALGYGGYRRWQARDRLEESCANCRSFVRFYLSDYAEAHDGWYPRGAATPLDSLAQCVKTELDIHHFTSHALSEQLKAYWRQHKTFSPELTCYRYNEGLRSDDPSNLIALYFHRPTRFECTSPKHEQPHLGRPVMCIDSSWTFLPEAEYQKRQAETLAFLEQRARLKPTAKTP